MHGGLTIEVVGCSREQRVVGGHALCARTLGASESFDIITSSTVPVPTCDFFTAGFSCKDLSHLNNRRAQLWQNIVDLVQEVPGADNSVGSTGHGGANRRDTATQRLSHYDIYYTYNYQL